jgi:hypothetical protein
LIAEGLKLPTGAAPSGRGVLGGSYLGLRSAAPALHPRLSDSATPWLARTPSGNGFGPQKTVAPKEKLSKRFDQLTELRNGIRHSRTGDEGTQRWLGCDPVVPAGAGDLTAGND